MTATQTTQITQAAPRVVAVETFTDEEVALLSGGAPMVVTPYLETLDEAARDAAARTAFRGLVARGVIDPPSDDALEAVTTAVPDAAGRVSVDLGVRGDVMSVMTLRDAAEQVLAVARTTAETQDFWYAHVVGAFTLVEEVSARGLHRFTLAHTADLLALVTSAVLHPSALDGTGEAVVLGTGPAGSDLADALEPPPALLAHLGAAFLRADLVVLSRTDPGAADRPRPEMTGLFTGPDGSWSLVADPATGTLTARPESLPALHHRLAGLTQLGEQVAAP